MPTVPAARGDGKTAVILLSGFLGAGKTTLLKHILSWEIDLSQTVVIVNEFGDIGIDGSLLKDSGTDVIELTSGCICCTLSADLRRSLESTWQRFRPQLIIIESSGVADPKSVGPVIAESELRHTMHLAKIITVLDADLWEARQAFGPLFYNQLEMASIILLNKIDLLEKEKIPQFLKEIHQVIPDCQVIPTIRCRVDPETLWSQGGPDTFGVKPIHYYHPADSNGHDHNHDDPEHQRSTAATPYVTFSFRSSQSFDEACFKEFIKALPWEMFRIKGPILFKQGLVMLNFVGGKAEWSDWEGEPETRLAFIGWGINPEELVGKLKSCLVDSY